MIGDTPYDAEAASGAGTAAAGVLTGGFSVESPSRSGLLCRREGSIPAPYRFGKHDAASARSGPNCQ